MSKVMVIPNKEINHLSSRQAMSLPEFVVADRLNNLSQLFNDYKNLSKYTLASIVENNNYLLPYRYVAGQILGLIEDPRINTLDPQMISVKGGEVEIGILSSEVPIVARRYACVGVKSEWIAKEAPKFTIHLSPFKIGKYLVTNSEYYIFLQETKFPELPSSWEFGIYPQHKSNHPVYTISINAAKEYTKWLSHLTKKHFRLLTEYEWEHAASGESHYEFPWGNVDKSGTCNTAEEKLYRSTPVGIFPEGNSPCGAADMAGNVEEYVENDYRPYPDAKIIQDDLFKMNQSYPITRGGSFTRFRDLARCSRRHGYYPKDIYVVGFRLAETI